VNLHMARGAVGILRVLVVLWARRFDCSHVVGQTVARQAQLIDCAKAQESWICRSVGCMTGRAAFSLHRSVLVDKRSLLVGVTLDASRVGAGRETSLFQLESAMRVMTVAAAHRTFEYLVMERHVELWLYLVMTTGAQLWIVCFQHANGGETGLLGVRTGNKTIRRGEVAAFNV